MKYSILLSLLLLSCAKIGHFKPVNLTPNEEKAAAEAFKGWCVASKGTKCAVLDPNGDAYIVLADELPHSYWGTYEAGRSRIVVRNVRSYPLWIDIFRAVMLHETGHFFFCGEEKQDFIGPSAMGTVSQGILVNGTVDLNGLRARKVCPNW